MKTVWLRHGLIISLIFGMGAAGCKSIGEGESHHSDADLSGIYDEQYLLRLAEVDISSAEDNETQGEGVYRFELCYATGKQCMGAFEDANGEDVLIELSMVNAFELPLAEYKYQELVQQVEEHYETKIAEHEEKVFVNKSIQGVGTAVIAASGFIGLSLPLVFYQQRGTYWIVKSLGAMMAGGAMFMSGDVVFSAALDKALRADKSLDTAKDHKLKLMDAHASLPKYLHIIGGILSTDQDNHIPVVGDERASVMDITFALARHLNATFGQYQQPPGNIVDFVCYLKPAKRTVVAKTIKICAAPGITD